MAKRDIEFLFEVGTLRNVPRAWQQIIVNRVQNISEHVFRVTLIAWIIASAEKADTAKVLKMCLVHDLSESRAGDIAFMHRDYVKRDEESAAKHTLEDTTIANEALTLLKEYEERKSLEAKIVKDADNLDVDLELKELAKMEDPAAIGMQKDHRHLVREQKLYTKTAKQMWDDIQKASPDSWHQKLTNKWIRSDKAAR